MADAGTGFDDGDGGVGAYEIDQPLAAAGDDDVHQPLGFQDGPEGLAVGGGQIAGGGQVVVGQRPVDEALDGQVGVARVPASLQHRRVAGLEVEGKDVKGDVGAGLENDPDYADGDAHPLQVDPVRQRFFFQDDVQGGG